MHIMMDKLKFTGRSSFSIYTRMIMSPRYPRCLALAKRTAIVAVALLVLLPAVALRAASSEARESLAVLTIGNSFADDATAFLPEMAKAGDKDLVIFRANLGGATMERHATHLRAFTADPNDPKGKPYRNRVHPKTGERQDFSLPEALEAYAWDVVTIQQVSHLSFRPETFHPFVDELITAIRRHAPQAEIVIHEIWAYREDHEFFQKGDGFTPRAMYERVSAAYRQLAKEKGLRLLVVGDAFNLARQTRCWSFKPDDELDLSAFNEGELPSQENSLNVGWFWRKGEDGEAPKLHLDAIHSNQAGRYLGASVWYLTLFGEDRVPDDFVPNGLDRLDAASLRQLAEAAVIAERAYLKRQD